jgi:phospholipase C
MGLFSPTKRQATISRRELLARGCTLLAGSAALAACGNRAVSLASLALPAPAVPNVSAAAAARQVPVPPAHPTTIDHVIVIYLENHSFDNLFGTFPGAEGLAQAGATATQIDGNGKPYLNLPAIMNAGLKLALPDARFPTLPNTPFDIDKFVPITQKTRDLVHAFYQEQMQINGGKMDRFAEVSDAAGLVMGYYDGSQTQLWKYAQDYVLADHFFHAAFGGSMLNHLWLVSAQTPQFPDAPDAMRSQVDAKGRLVKDGAVSPDGYAINNLYTANTPHPARTPADRLMPPLTIPHIGDRLDTKSISWAWYSAGWNDAAAGKPDPGFYFVCQPFAYFANVGDGTESRAKHLRDEQDFFSALQSGGLPNVSFVKPLQPDAQHPGEADVMRGDRHTASLIEAVKNSPYWERSAIIVTYDEHGGFWDHVPPPQVDRWGPGIRVPAVVISPFAKKGFVDKTVYDTTSILSFLEWRWGLDPLSSRDAAANNLTNAFDL